MKGEILSRLFDIRTSLDQIFYFLPEPRDYFEFRKDLKTQKAVEMKIEIIGKAVNQFVKDYPEMEILNSGKIVDTRNRINRG